VVHIVEQGLNCQYKPYLSPRPSFSLPLLAIPSQESLHQLAECYNCSRSQLSRVCAVLIELFYDINDSSCFTGFFITLCFTTTRRMRTLFKEKMCKRCNRVESQTNIAQCAVKADPKITTESNTISMTTKSKDNHWGQWTS